MQRDEIRLECLKLTYRRDRPAEESVRDAEILEHYLLKDGSVSSDKGVEPVQKRRGRPPLKKSVDNPDVFN